MSTSTFFCASAREVKKYAVVKATTESKTISKTTSFEEVLIQVTTKSAREIIVMLIKEKKRENLEENWVSNEENDVVTSSRD